MTRWHATRRELAGRAIGEIVRTAACRWCTGDVPRTPHDITAEQLSELTGHAVDTLAVVDEEHGTATRARLKVVGSGLPATVFVKTTPTRPVERIFHNVAGLGATEAKFYRLIAPELPECTPWAFGARWDPRTGRSIVVVEDLAASDVRFAGINVSCTADEARAVVRTLAAVQARFWNSARFGGDLAGFSERASPSVWYGSYTTALVTKLPHRYDDIVDASFRQDALILHTRADDIAACFRALPQSLLHGDTHRGNIGFGGSGVTLFDWQVCRQGAALKDLAYFAATSLDPQVRAPIERDLVGEYAEITGTDPAAAWDAYRLLLVTGYTAAAFTALFGGRLQSDENARAGLSRAVAAVSDHDSLARLSAVLT